jgi:SH3-like domain-containing protein
MQCRVLADHVPAYPDPIAMCTGDVVALGRRDPEFPGWVWCTAADGRCGWVADAYLEVVGGEGIARREYSAAELAVRAGETVELVEEESGWAWVTAAGGRAGWVPRAKLGAPTAK